MLQVGRQYLHAPGTPRIPGIGTLYQLVNGAYIVVRTHSRGAATAEFELNFAVVSFRNHWRRCREQSSLVGQSPSDLSSIMTYAIRCMSGAETFLSVIQLLCHRWS